LKQIEKVQLKVFITKLSLNYMLANYLSFKFGVSGLIVILRSFLCWK